MANGRAAAWLASTLVQAVGVWLCCCSTASRDVCNLQRTNPWTQINIPFGNDITSQSPRSKQSWYLPPREEYTHSQRITGALTQPHFIGQMHHNCVGFCPRSWPHSPPCFRSVPGSPGCLMNQLRVTCIILALLSVGHYCNTAIYFLHCFFSHFVSISKHWISLVSFYFWRQEYNMVSPCQDNKAKLPANCTFGEMSEYCRYCILAGNWICSTQMILP